MIRHSVFEMAKKEQKIDSDVGGRYLGEKGRRSLLFYYSNIYPNNI